jgi:hypothetical protein
MSKQIRVDDATHECLKRLAKKHGRSITDCALEAIGFFDSLIAEIERDNKLVIEKPNGDREVWKLLLTERARPRKRH